MLNLLQLKWKLTNYPITLLQTKNKQLMRCLVMVAFYRKFCKNIPSITDLKKINYTWNNNCDNAFKRIKTILISNPVFVSEFFKTI